MGEMCGRREREVLGKIFGFLSREFRRRVALCFEVGVK